MSNIYTHYITHTHAYTRTTFNKLYTSIKLLIITIQSLFSFSLSVCVCECEMHGYGFTLCKNRIGNKVIRSDTYTHTHSHTRLRYRKMKMSNLTSIYICIRDESERAIVTELISIKTFYT